MAVLSRFAGSIRRLLGFERSGEYRIAGNGAVYGLHVARVTDLRDPDGRGRVQVELAALADGPAWARVALPNATWLLPDAGDEVLVAFENGDVRRPCVVGALWTGTDQPPLTMDGAGANDVKAIVSRKGHKLLLDDGAGDRIELKTSGGHQVTLDDSSQRVEIKDANGNRVVLDTTGAKVEASGRVEITAASVSVNAGSAKFSGVVECDTMIANSVVASSYTPGAGNIA